MNKVFKIVEDEEKVAEQSQAWTMEKVKEYVKAWAEYEEQIKIIRESRSDWSKDFIKNNNLPKKELAQAMQIVKRDLDTEVITEIIENIENML